MKLIFAQGNPGSHYAQTRHNVGWQILDAAADGVDFTLKPKFFATIAETSIAGEKVMFVKPQTFYNETGKSIRAIVDFYKLTPSTDLLVIHDELALPLGTLRLRDKGSDAGNNGIKSINATLGEHYHRVRVGIRNDLYGRVSDADFVLARFTADEQAAVSEKIIPKSLELITAFVAGTHEVTSHSLMD